MAYWPLVCSKIVVIEGVITEHVYRCEVAMAKQEKREDTIAKVQKTFFIERKVAYDFIGSPIACAIKKTYFQLKFYRQLDAYVVEGNHRGPVLE